MRRTKRRALSRRTSLRGAKGDTMKHRKIRMHSPVIVTVLVVGIPAALTARVPVTPGHAVRLPAGVGHIRDRKGR